MIIIASVIGVFLILSILIYNGLIGKKNEVENANGGLDAQLKQRYDLIPNIVSTVKQYMEHEKSVLEKIVMLRSKALKGGSERERESVNKEISTALSGLMVQVEQYPDLKSNTNFMNLQNTLYEIEENIAAARRFYNSAVTEYNNALEMFPSNIFAKLLSYKRKEVFNIPELEKKNPNIQDLLNNE